MSIATLTTKGQLTLPKDVRDRLRLKAGEKFACTVRGADEIVLTRRKIHALDLVGFLPPPKRKLSLAEIDAVVEKVAVERFKRKTRR